MSTDGRTRAQAGVLAATLARQTARVGAAPWPAALFPRLTPPSVGGLPALFDWNGQNDGDKEIKNARATAVALLNTVPESFDDGLLDSLLTKKEKESRVLADHREKIRTLGKDQKICRYCDLKNSLIYGKDSKNWNAVSINHDANITARFDPRTCVSTGKIANFQVLVPNLAAAQEIVRRAHPLQWAEAAPTLFIRSDAAEPRGNEWLTLPQSRDTSIAEWRKKSKADPRYVYESVSWPWNEYAAAAVENIIKISGFVDDAGKTLSYDYSLESCIRSSFGVAWEDGGLDVDAGSYSANISALNTAGGDLVLNQGYSDKTGALTRPADTLQRLAESLDWSDAHLVTISASKALRYTMPKNSPPEMRGFLNATAPALISTFLTRSFCDSVYMI